MTQISKWFSIMAIAGGVCSWDFSLTHAVAASVNLSSATRSYHLSARADGEPREYLDVLETGAGAIGFRELAQYDDFNAFARGIQSSVSTTLLPNAAQFDLTTSTAAVIEYGCHGVCQVGYTDADATSEAKVTAVIDGLVDTGSYLLQFYSSHIPIGEVNTGLLTVTRGVQELAKEPLNTLESLWSLEVDGGQQIRLDVEMKSRSCTVFPSFYSCGTGGKKYPDNDFDSQSLSLTIRVALPGDYNGDGTVDAADEVAWRKIDGTEAGYNTWRENFGRTLNGSGSAFDIAESRANVPEPASGMLAALAALIFTSAQVRRSR